MFSHKRRTVTITDQGFDPPGVPAVTGHPVLVEFYNASSQPHVVEFELPSGAVRLVEPLAPGRRTFVRFVSETTGVFYFRCLEDARMRGSLVIESAPGMPGMPGTAGMPGTPGAPGAQAAAADQASA